MEFASHWIAEIFRTQADPKWNLKLFMDAEVCHSIHLSVIQLMSDVCVPGLNCLYAEYYCVTKQSQFSEHVLKPGTQEKKMS